MRKHTAVGAIAAASVIAAALTGCSGGGSGSSDVSCTNTIVHKDAPVVTVWGWYQSLETVADQFNESHSDVQVCWTNAGQGGDQYTKLKTALAAGSGAPDIVQIEYDQLYSYTINGSLVDLSEYGADDLASKFNEGTWKDVSYGGKVWEIPVDSGPMAVYYRQDLLEKAGITKLPTTWDEFAAAAEQYKASGAEGSFVNFPLNGEALIMGLLYQAGAEPFAYDPSEPTDVTIDLDQEASARVLDYWFSLIQSGAVSHDDAWTADAGSKIAQGGYASYIGASWSASYISGLAGGDADARWTVAPLPQWDASAPRQTAWTAGGLAVTSQAKDKKLAAEVVMSLFDTDEARAAQIESQIFPAQVAAQADPSFVDQKFDFYGGQELNKEVFIPAQEGYQGVQYSPFSSYLYSTMNTMLPDAVASGESAEDALAAIQAALVDYAKKQGFAVTQ